MTRRITCYVVLVTLIWGAHTEEELKARDIFKSNMTRNDFSNLLQSLIKLNEQRVSVLQRLYRLEDYGVLSEVLRSGDKKTGNGNPNNLFLIVMSKNQNDPSRRKVAFQVVDSVTSLDVGSNTIQPKLDFVLDPVSYFSNSIRKENRLESIFENISTKIHRADDGNKQIGTTKKTLNYGNPGLRTGIKHDSNELRAVESSLEANEDKKHNKENSRFEVMINKGKRFNASEKLLNDDVKSNKYPQTVGYNSQSNKYIETDFTTKNDKLKLTTKLIKIKHILSSNHKKSKYPIEGKDEQDEDDYVSPIGNIQNVHKSQYTKMDSNIPVKKPHVSNHHIPKRNQYTLKVKVQSNQQNVKLTTKKIKIKHILSSNHKKSKYPIEGKDEQDEDDYVSPIGNIENVHNSQYTKNGSDIPDKKPHVNNHHIPKTNTHTPKVKDQINQQNVKLTSKPIKIKHILSNNHKKSKYPIEGKDEQDEDDYVSPIGNIENVHKSQYTKMDSNIPVKKPHVNNHHIPKRNQYTLKVKVQSNQQNVKLTTKKIKIKHILSSNHKKSKYPIEGKDEQDEDDYVSPIGNIENVHNSQYTKNGSDIPDKKPHVNNHHIPKTNTHTPKVKDQINQQNFKLTSKPIKIKHILSNNHKKSKYPIEGKDEQDKDDYVSPIGNIENVHKSQYTKMDSYIPVKKPHVNNHHIRKTNKHPPKVKVRSKPQNHKLMTKPIITEYMSSINHQRSDYTVESKYGQDEDYYGSSLSNIENDNNSQYTNINSDISIKKVYANNHQNPKTNKNTPKVKVQSNQHPKLNQNKSLINNQGNKYHKIKTTIETTTRKNYHRIKYGTVNSYKASLKYIRIKNPGLNKHNTNAYNRDRIYTKIKHKNATKEIDNDTQFPLLASENVYGSKIPEPTKNTPYGSYPDFDHHKDIRDNFNKDKLETPIDTIFGNDQGSEDHKDVRDNTNRGKPETAKDTPFGNYHGSEDHEDVRDSSNRDKPETTKNTPFGNYHGSENHKDVRDSYNRDKPKTAKDTPFGNYQGSENYKDVRDTPETGKDTPFGNYHGSEDHIDVRDSYNKDKPETAKDTPFGNYQGSENYKDVRDSSNRDKPETAKDTPFGNYHSSEDHKDVRDSYNRDKPETAKNTPFGNYHGSEDHKDVRYSSNRDKLETAKDTPFGNYHGTEDHKDIRDSFNRDTPETAKDTPFGNRPSFELYKDVRDNSNKDKPKTKTIGEGNFHGFEHHKNVMDNLNKHKLNTESKKDTDYDGVKMFDNGKSSTEQFTVFITSNGNRTAEEVKQQNDPKLILNAFDKSQSKPVARKPFTKCLNKKAIRLCCKSCISAYKNVCRRLKCTSRSKKALKTECKRSCKKTFASSSSKYSDENSNESSDDD